MSGDDGSVRKIELCVAVKKWPVQSFPFMNSYDLYSDEPWLPVAIGFTDYKIGDRVGTQYDGHIVSGSAIVLGGSEQGGTMTKVRYNNGYLTHRYLHELFPWRDGLEYGDRVPVQLHTVCLTKAMPIPLTFKFILPRYSLIFKPFIFKSQ